MKEMREWSDVNQARAAALAAPLIEQWGQGAQAQLVTKRLDADHAALILQVLAVEHREPFNASITLDVDHVADHPELLPRMEEALLALLEAKLGIQSPPEGPKGG